MGEKNDGFILKWREVQEVGGSFFVYVGGARAVSGVECFQKVGDRGNGG